MDAEGLKALHRLAQGQSPVHYTDVNFLSWAFFWRSGLWDLAQISGAEVANQNEETTLVRFLKRCQPFVAFQLASSMIRKRINWESMPEVRICFSTTLEIWRKFSGALFTGSLLQILSQNYTLEERKDALSGLESGRGDWLDHTGYTEPSFSIIIARVAAVFYQSDL